MQTTLPIYSKPTITNNYFNKQHNLKNPNVSVAKDNFNNLATSFLLSNKSFDKKISSLEEFYPVISSGLSPRRTKTLTEIGEEFSEDFSNFSNIFSQLLSTNQNKYLPDFNIKLNGKGGIDVTPPQNHNAKQLKETFHQHPTLTNRFALMAARGSLLEAAKQNPEFAKDYKNDAVKCVEKHIDLLKEYLLSFSFNTNGNAHSYNFGNSEKIIEK